MYANVTIKLSQKNKKKNQRFSKLKTQKKKKNVLNFKG
jgi:hypothetical protein